MHVLTNASAHGLTPIDPKGQPYASDVVTFGGRVRTQTGRVMLFAGTDSDGDPRLLQLRYSGRLPAMLRRLTTLRRRA